MNAERLAVPVAAVLALAFFGGCAADPSLTWQRELVGTTYTDQTHNFRISAPNANWEIEMSSQDFGAGWFILNMFRPVYNAAVSIGVAKEPITDLDAFAKIQLGQHEA